jgi:pyruvate dehydrogenase E2 component (dihydrolipoamide acetyltransferase)
MPTEVRLPELGGEVTSAKLVSWLKQEGDAVTAGDIIAEVETDKTNVELEAPGSGVLEKIHVPVGQSAAVGDLLAVIGEPAAAERWRPRSRTTAPPEYSGAAATPRRTVEMPESPSAIASVETPATPLAARMAVLAGIDLASIRPTGADGRITKADVEHALGHHKPVPTMQFEDQPLSAMRRVTAERLQLAKQTIPHFYLEVDCNVEALLNLRAQVNAGWSEGKVTVTDFLVLAISRALGKVRLANSNWMDGALRVFTSVDIAVAVNTPKGLITPVIRGTEKKTLLGVSQELKALAERARKGQLKAEEYTGGTCTLSNLGMFGVSRITPIINPPQSCILGVGAIESRAVVKDGRVDVGQVMVCTLAADHRAIDGATGAELLSEIRRLIEQPMSLISLS